MKKKDIILMKKVLLMFLVLTCSVLALMGCKSKLSSNDLSGKTYVLDNRFGSDSGVFISFDGEKFAGKSVINNFFGSYKIENGSKFVANDSGMSTGMTMMAGAPDDMENDKVFLDLFNGVNKIELKGKTLTLTTESGEKLVFTEASGSGVATIDATAFPETEGEPVGDLGLENDIMAFVNKEYMLSNMFQGTDITFVILEDNKIAGKVVNNYMANYSVDDDHNFVIESPMGTTRMMGEPTAMQAETDYLELLGSVVSLSVLDNKLILTTNDDRELIFE